MTSHSLKTHPDQFQFLVDGSKRFEWRRDDRTPRFEVGDELELAEWVPPQRAVVPGLPGLSLNTFALVPGYTGRSVTARVCHVLREGFELPAGYCVLGLDCVRLNLNTYQEDVKLVRRLQEIDHGLTEWEVSFVGSLSDWVDKGMKLTDKQRERALQIDEAK